MKQSDLKNGLEFSYCTPNTVNDFRVAEASFNNTLNRFCIMFNGKIFSFKTFLGMKRKLDDLIKKWSLEDITHFVRINH
jgi:hypothetical protein